MLNRVTQLLQCNNNNNNNMKAHVFLPKEKLRTISTRMIHNTNSINVRQDKMTEKSF